MISRCGTVAPPVVLDEAQQVALVLDRHDAARPAVRKFAGLRVDFEHLHEDAIQQRRALRLPQLLQLLPQPLRLVRPEAVQAVQLGLQLLQLRGGVLRRVFAGLLASGMTRKTQNSSVSTSISGMKKRVTLRRGIWSMLVSRNVSFARRPTGQGADRVAADEDHPRRQNVNQGHQQAAARRRDRRRGTRLSLRPAKPGPFRGKNRTSA